MGAQSRGRRATEAGRGRERKACNTLVALGVVGYYGLIGAAAISPMFLH
jgi:hypothetical protein